MAKQLMSGITQELQRKFWRLNDRNDFKSWITLGDLYMKECKYNEAINCYETAIRSNNSIEYVALYKQAKAYSKLSNSEKEIECLQRVLSMINYMDADMKIAVNALQKLQKFIEEKNS